MPCLTSVYEGEYLKLFSSPFLKSELISYWGEGNNKHGM